MRTTAADGAWAEIIGHTAAERVKILPLEDYYDLLAGEAAEIDMWRTTYYHLMDSAAAILSWVRATGLRPFIEPLDKAMQAAFLREYERRIAEAYPARGDGKLVLPFPRVFVVARRGEFSTAC